METKLTSDMEDHKSVLGSVQESLERLLVQMFYWAWKIFPFHVVNLVFAFFSFNLFTKEGGHLLDGAVFFELLYSFTVTKEKVKHREWNVWRF